MKYKIEKIPLYSDYNSVVDVMEKKVQDVIDSKSLETIYLVEHDHVITMGSSAKLNELKNDSKIPLIKTGRGGKLTYHGPGQRVVYLVINLNDKIWSKNLKKYLNFLHELVIETLAEFNIKAHSRDDHVGVWVNDGIQDSKIAAIGIRARKWVVFHGFAVNINTDLSKYSSFVPCGISDLGVTSLKNLGVNISIDNFDDALIKIFNKKIIDL